MTPTSMYLALVCLILGLFPLATSISAPTIKVLSPHGVRFEIKDVGYELVALHFSINKKLPGVKAGDFNVDIKNTQGGYFVYENKDVTIKHGDYVAYWVYGVMNGLAQQLLDQEWRFTDTTSKPHINHPTLHPDNHATQATASSGTNNTTSKPHINHPTPHPDNHPTPHPDNHATQATYPSSGTNTYQQTPQQKSCSSYPCLIFEDNFDFINHQVWQHELTLGGGGNWEFQQYTNNRSNSYCKNGVLYIKPTLTTDAMGDNFLESGSMDIWGTGPHDTCTGNAFYGCKRDGAPGRVINPIQSARMRSSRGFNFKYGKVEIEAKLPTGDWIWPAIWMMPTWATYGQWPASGEIDIMESRGNLNYKDSQGNPAGVDHVGSTLHFGPNWQHDPYYRASASKNLHSGTFGQKFHKYGVEWDENAIKFSIDGDVILNVTPDSGGFWKFGGFDKTGMENPWRHASKMAPFDQEYYIILNVAVGGLHYFADTNHGPRPKPWKDTSAQASTDFWRAKNQWYPTWNPHVRDGEDAALQINHIKVWKMKP